MTIRRGVVRALALVTALALPLSLTSPAQAAGGLDEVFAKLLVKQVKGANVSKHLKAFQAIADANGGQPGGGHLRLRRVP
ncbi:hypothetical protein ACFSTC_47360 [Nonomuraea ferruginea]